MGENIVDTERTTAPRLSRDAILDVALSLIDEQGLNELSMRHLGKALGVEAMSLYRYVNGREDLLEGVVDRLMRGLTDALLVAEDNGWQRYLQVVAHEVRRIAIEHPKAFPLVATRHPAAPWLRPPLRSVEVVEHFLTAMIGFGFDDEQAVRAYRSFSSFLLGNLLLEAAVRGAETAPVEEPLDEGGAAIGQGDAEKELADTPHVQRLRGLLSRDRSEDEFEESLEALLDRLDHQLSQ